MLTGCTSLQMNSELNPLDEYKVDAFDVLHFKLGMW